MSRVQFRILLGCIIILLVLLGAAMCSMPAIDPGV